MGLPQRETSGEEGASHGHGIPGCSGNSFKKNIFCNALILVSAERAQSVPTTCFMSYWHRCVSLRINISSPSLCKDAMISWGWKSLDFSMSLPVPWRPCDSLFHFVHWKMHSLFKLYLFPFFCLFLLLLVSSRKSSLNALSARRHVRVVFLLCHPSTRFHYVCLEFNLWHAMQSWSQGSGSSLDILSLKIPFPSV